MAQFSGLLLLVSFAAIYQVQGADYGKITCVGTSATPSAKLLTTFTKNCDLPKEATDAAKGNALRCIFEYTKVFTSPSTFNAAKVDSDLAGVMPTKYQESFKTSMKTCIKNNSKAAKGSKDDATGKTWIGMFNCLNTWVDKNLCK